jgi:hypothetical protein
MRTMRPQCRCMIPEFDEKSLDLAEHFEVPLPSESDKEYNEMLYSLQHQSCLALDEGVVCQVPEDAWCVAEKDL